VIHKFTVMTRSVKNVHLCEIKSIFWCI